MNKALTAFACAIAILLAPCALAAEGSAPSAPASAAPAAVAPVSAATSQVDAAPDATTTASPPVQSATAATAPVLATAAPKRNLVRVSVQTTVGTIVLELEKDRAPITTANFLRYAQEKRFDGMAFYRALKLAPGYALIQGGTSGNPKRNLKPINHEPTTVTGLSHVNGVVSMARGAPGTAAGDFFIIVGDLTSLDADPKLPGDNLGYAAFGHVADGMETVLRIADAPTSATKGDAAMKGQMIEAPIKIIAVKRLP